MLGYKAHMKLLQTGLALAGHKWLATHGCPHMLGYKACTKLLRDFKAGLALAGHNPGYDWPKHSVSGSQAVHNTVCTRLVRRILEVHAARS